MSWSSPSRTRDRASALRTANAFFDPFFRTEMAKDSEVSGHGLVAFCQPIVLAHHGRIQVTDRPGVGARFSVYLPAQVQARALNDDAVAKDRGNDPTGAEFTRALKR